MFVFFQQIDGVSGRQILYGQLADAVKRVQSGLTRQGFKQGDVLCMFAPNSIEYALCMLAVPDMGGVLTGANPIATSGKSHEEIKGAVISDYLGGWRI